VTAAGIWHLLWRGVGQVVLVTFLVTALTFGLAALMPGDFVTILEANPNVRPELVAQLRSQYGLNEPLLLQYLRWLGRMVELDFGFSLHYMRPVRAVLSDAILNSLWLGLPALCLGLVAGVGLGSLHALWASRPMGRLLDALSAMLLSLPALLLGIAAMLVAAATGWFPVGGVASAQLGEAAPLVRLVDRLHHLILPVACLTLPVAAMVERIQYAAVRGASHEPYFQYARARGLGRARVFLHYLVRPSLNPVLSVVAPLLGAHLGGNLVLEHMFAWPGLGLATYEALVSRDTFLLLGCVSVGTVLLVVGNALADLLLYLVDPRTRGAGREPA